MASRGPGSPPQQDPAWVVWRHPRPIGASARCIGHTEIPIDRRKAKRLAHRIRGAARLHGWPRIVHTSDLRRCAEVGRQLRRWGWHHCIHPQLREMDFGCWDGRLWQEIPQAQIDDWCTHFLDARPGNGESLRGFLQRVKDGQATIDAALGPHANARLVVAHAGCMLAMQWLMTRTDLPTHASLWPPPPRYNECWQWPAVQPALINTGP